MLLNKLVAMVWAIKPLLHLPFSCHTSDSTTSKCFVIKVEGGCTGSQLFPMSGTYRGKFDSTKILRPCLSGFVLVFASVYARNVMISQSLQHKKVLCRLARVAGGFTCNMMIDKCSPTW